MLFAPFVRRVVVLASFSEVNSQQYDEDSFPGSIFSRFLSPWYSVLSIVWRSVRPPYSLWLVMGPYGGWQRSGVLLILLRHLHHQQQFMRYRTPFSSFRIETWIHSHFHYWTRLNLSSQQCLCFWFLGMCPSLIKVLAVAICRVSEAHGLLCDLCIACYNLERWSLCPCTLQCSFLL